LLFLIIRLSVYEDRELQAAEKRAQERLEFENQIMKIQTMLEFERSRDTAGHVEQIIKEVASLEDALQKCQKNEKKYRKVCWCVLSKRREVISVCVDSLKIIEELQHEVGEIKERLLDQKTKIEFQEREISDCTKRATQLNKDYNEQRKRLQLIDSDMERLRIDRHNYYRTAKVFFYTTICGKQRSSQDGEICPVMVSDGMKMNPTPCPFRLV
jgi:chromosome segregation ATPase